MDDLSRAKALLQSENCTLALVCGGDEIVRFERGVVPLLNLYDAKKDVRSYSAADRVIGKAAAFLYVLLGVKHIYAEVLSEPAEQVLLGHGIHVEAQERVERIVNRAKNGLCPMESATVDIEDPQVALAAIRKQLAALRGA